MLICRYPDLIIPVSEAREQIETDREREDVFTFPFSDYGGCNVARSGNSRGRGLFARDNESTDGIVARLKSFLNKLPLTNAGSVSRDNEGF